MARPIRITFSGAFYHITSRGNERKPIFYDARDKEKFLSYLQSASKRYKASIHVYCLMMNHYHLLLETPKGNLPQIMHHLNGAYTTYFNIKRQRAGHLFQGRYKAILIEVDAYAKELSRYIHLNPVRAKMVEKPHQYAWASYPFYIGDLKPPQWLVTDFLLRYFGNNTSIAQKQYRDFVDALENTDYESPLKNTTGSAVLGSGNFIQTIKNEFFKDKKPERDLPGMKAFISRLSFEKVAEAVESEIGQDRSLSRGLKLYFCHQYTGRTLKEIGEQFGVGQSAVSQASRRIKMKTEKNEPLQKIIKSIEIRLDLSKV